VNPILLMSPAVDVPPSGGGVARQGRVHAAHHAVVDDGGPFCALGASLFWLQWGYLNDRPRLEQNLAFLAKYGVDYVRALGTVGWPDRTIDPTAPGWAEACAAVTDLAYVQGLRVQWTVFGGIEDCPTERDQERVIDAMIAMSHGREHKIFAFEVANEGFATGFPGDEGRERLRRLGDRLRAGVPHIVALTAPTDDAVCRMYRDWHGGAATIHFDRDDRSDRGWRFVRQPWGWPDEYRARESYNGALPDICFNNEPKGPQSSVSQTDDPMLLQFAYLDTFIAGVGAYVLHTGAGVQGGGAADMARGRVANLWETPNIDAILSAHQAIRRVLPGDLANWSRQNAQWQAFPFDGLAQAVADGRIVRSHAAINGADCWLDILGLQAPVVGTAKRDLTITAIDPFTAAEGTPVRLSSGAQIVFAGAAGQLFRLRF